jgi:hypothetical protein
MPNADYDEWDCSFQALKPYVYSIPLAVKANVGIPLGIVMALSKRRDVFSIFADLPVEKGFSESDLFEIPFISDAGTALRSYAEGLAGRRGYYGHHYLYYRHLLEALGSDTLVALLARRLLFTRTQNAYQEAYPQTVADFVLGCQQGMISPNGRAKFGNRFGINLTQSDGNACPKRAQMTSGNTPSGASGGLVSALPRVQIILKECRGD